MKTKKSQPPRNADASRPDDAQSPLANDWQSRLAEVVDLMHEMSLHTEPQEMVKAYAARLGRLYPVDRRIALSRRDLAAPEVRVTRYSEWQESINPWIEKERLPLIRGGLFAELIYTNRPHLIDNLQVDPSDPAASYLENQRSLVAIPMYDRGEALNMVISTRTERDAFDRDQFPQSVWLANLFGRATHNLVLRKEIRNAFDRLDRELQIVGDIQMSLLPKATPTIERVELDTYYRTSQRAGGDYYDFFQLDADRTGILVADVSGHGTPAAVVMAITHSIAHLCPRPIRRPSDLLEFLNRELCERYTTDGGTFVTALFAIYDRSSRVLEYASAGHQSPMVWRCPEKEVHVLRVPGDLPLGIMDDAAYHNLAFQLGSGDRFVIYTDGITDAAGPDGEPFGETRLHEIMSQSCRHSSVDLTTSIVNRLDAFTGGNPPEDDRTLVVGMLA